MEGTVTLTKRFLWSGRYENPSEKKKQPSGAVPKKNTKKGSRGRKCK